MNNQVKIFKNNLKNMIRDNSNGVNVYEAIEVLEEIIGEIRECAEKTTSVQNAICLLNGNVNRRSETYL